MEIMEYVSLIIYITIAENYIKKMLKYGNNFIIHDENLSNCRMNYFLLADIIFNKFLTHALVKLLKATYFHGISGYEKK